MFWDFELRSSSYYFPSWNPTPTQRMHVFLLEVVDTWRDRPWRRRDYSREGVYIEDKSGNPANSKPPSPRCVNEVKLNLPASVQLSSQNLVKHT